ncbi:aa3-type cytochrome oxidase subunit II [Pseudoclavibacter sp. 13-3]|uniref:aa3-type cytochrome oxidase subunit II n=1 Tax=Pseudoclavibacter sp. 13-3 TaxID=2901228 RepID=UPI0022B247B9|nr:cytochrome c oxidase subunit II [Pseudoclavibacter sp. 13-3]
MVRSRVKRAVAASGVLGIAALALSGCSDDAKRGFLPASDTTDHTQQITDLWVHSWVVLLGVGLVVWGLVVWCVVVYRRRKGDTGVPAQTRYNLPIEVLYTAVPFVLIIGFFIATVHVQSATEAKATPAYDGADVQVQIVGKQWSWDINYLTNDGAPDVHEDAGVQADYVTGPTFDESKLPTLYLPVDKEVKIKLDARDVAHSFWVPQFLYKKDLLPGVHNNYWTFTPEKEGTFPVKCAELCGEYHSMMLMNVKVVSDSEYQAHVTELRERGNTGALGHELDRRQDLKYNSTDAEQTHSAAAVTEN